jgi:hypothetical protein
LYQTFSWNLSVKKNYFVAQILVYLPALRRPVFAQPAHSAYFQLQYPIFDWTSTVQILLQFLDKG